MLALYLIFSINRHYLIWEQPRRRYERKQPPGGTIHPWGILRLKKIAYVDVGDAGWPFYALLLFLSAVSTHDHTALDAAAGMITGRETGWKGKKLFED